MGQVLVGRGDNPNGSALRPMHFGQNQYAAGLLFNLQVADSIRTSRFMLLHKQAGYKTAPTYTPA